MISTFFIIGATGQQGGATARELLLMGATVHALVRDPTSKASKILQALGAKIFKGDLLDPSSMERAMSGTTGVFLNTIMDPPSPDAPDSQVQQAQNVIDVAKKARTVTTIVVSTVICASRYDEWLAQDPENMLLGYLRPKDAVEKVVRAANFKNHTILRPGWLMHNYLGTPPTKYNYPELDSGHFIAASYPPSTKLAHFSAGDVGKFAAAALTNSEKFNGLEIDLASENLTLGEVTRYLSAASGVEIKAKFRTNRETSEVEPSKLPGIIFQLAMARSPTVYEFDVGVTEGFGIKLTTFEEYFAGEPERSELRNFLGVTN